MVGCVKRVTKKFLFHLCSIIVIIFSSIILFYNNIISSDGILMYVDMTWPLSVGRIIEIHVYTWWPYGSTFNLENIIRILWSLPFLGPVILLNLSVKEYLSYLFIGTFAIAGITMYIVAYRLLNHLLGSRLIGKLIGCISALVVALVYMYNPWSLNHLWTYFFYPTYALLPLIFFYLLRSFEEMRMRYIMITSILSTLATTSPHSVVWIFFIYFTLLIYFLLLYKQRLKILGTILLLLLLYVLMNLHWILPYLYTLKTPAYLNSGAFTPQVLYIFSKENIFVRSIRLVGGWGLPINYPEDPLWIVASFALPMFIYGFLLIFWEEILKKQHLIWYLFIISLIVIFLGKGSTPPLGSWYEWLVFKLPIGWVFRAPDRWLIFLSLGYSLILAFIFSIILSKIFIRKNIKDIKNISLLAILLIFAVAYVLYMYPIISQYTKTVFSPTRIPSEYLDLTKMVFENSTKGIVFPLYRPGGFLPEWGEGKRIGPFLIYSLPITNINSFNWLFEPNSTLFILESMLEKSNQLISIKTEANYSDCIRKLLVALGIKYIVLDTGVKYVDYDGKLKSGRELLQSFRELFREPIYGHQYVYVFINNISPDIKLMYIPKVIFTVKTPMDICYLLSYFDEPQEIAIFLQQNNHTLSIPSIYINKLNKSSNNFTFIANISTATILNYSLVDYTTWKAVINANSPFFLVFTEAYDPFWEARVYRDGELVKVIKPIPVYGVINGFWISETGNLTIVIRYVLQDWFELGLKISIATFALSVFYVVWDWRRGRGDTWALWLERRVKSIVKSRIS